MYAIEYRKPKTVDEASRALAESAGKALAGGQSLVAAMKLRLAQPGTVVDLGGIAELRGIRVEGNTLVIGALTRHAEVAASGTVKGFIPALCALAEGIGDRQVRNMGTIGGSIANADPAADWPAALVACNATVVTSKRRVPAEQFFRGMFETALAPDELVVAVSFPQPKQAAYAKFPNPASRFALVGVFVAKFADGAVRVAVAGAGPSVFRAAAIEAALAKSFTPEAARRTKVDASGLNGDLHGSPEYRAHLTAVMAARAVAAA